MDTFDPEACIGYLLDKTQPEAQRGAAAESLGYYGEAANLGPSISRAVDALYHVVCDQDDLFIIREEAAQSLSNIWAEIGVDRTWFARIPEDMKFEVLASIPPGPGRVGLE